MYMTTAPARRRRPVLVVTGRGVYALPGRGMGGYVTCPDGTPSADMQQYFQTALAQPAAAPTSTLRFGSAAELVAIWRQALTDRQAAGPGCPYGTVSDGELLAAAQSVIAARAAAANPQPASNACAAGSIPYNGINSDQGCRPVGQTAYGNYPVPANLPTQQISNQNPYTPVWSPSSSVVPQHEQWRAPMPYTPAPSAPFEPATFFGPPAGPTVYSPPSYSAAPPRPTVFEGPAPGSLTSGLPSALTQNVNVLGVNVPLWGAAAAGLAAVWMLSGKR